jgi:hypothetical protein
MSVVDAPETSDRERPSTSWSAEIAALWRREMMCDRARPTMPFWSAVCEALKLMA